MANVCFRVILCVLKTGREGTTFTLDTMDFSDDKNDTMEDDLYSTVRAGGGAAAEQRVIGGE